MAKLLSIIPLQAFERIRDRIGEILVEEFVNQYNLIHDDNLNPAVYVERIVPFDNTELPAINVALSTGDYSNKNVKCVDGAYNYSIDCYASAATVTDPEDPTKVIRADYLAAMTVQRLLGMCRAILENPAYRTLNYVAPFNCSVQVTGIKMADPENVTDATMSAMGHLEFSVRVPEYSELIDAVPLGGSDTTVKLALTEKGYRYIYDMPEIIYYISQGGQYFTTQANETFIKN